MKKEYIVIIILSVLLAIEGVAWILSSQPKGKSWVFIGAWGGSQRDYNMTTEQFVTTGDEWFIECSTTQATGGSGLDILVYDVYTGNVVKEITTSVWGLSNESYFNTKGRFYLKIYVLGDSGSWSVSVNDYR